MPSQFQLRDLVNHLLLGAVVLLLAALFCFLLFPATWAAMIAAWPEAQTKLGAGLLVPISLVIAYTVGATVPSSALLFGRTDGLLASTLRVLRIIKPADYVEPSIANSLIPEVFHVGAGRFFGALAHGISDEDLFRLASTRVLEAPSSMQQIDIERHFVLKTFNARLCALFLISCLLSLLAAVLSAVRVLNGYAVPHTQLIASLFLVLLFYSTARASGRKAQQNHSHWRALIMRSFVILAMQSQTQADPK